MGKKTRWLLQSFVLSIVLNIIQTILFLYFIIKDNPLTLSFKPQREEYEDHPPCSRTFLARIEACSFSQLLELLEDDREVAGNWRIQDFALGVLVSKHFFDIRRALERAHPPEKKWVFEDREFSLFPRLKNEDFKKLQEFGKKETWPLTTEGLFHKIREQGMEITDPALLRLFCYTPEFVFFETFFARQSIAVQRKELLSLLIEGGWPLFHAFWEEQKKEVDFSKKAWREVCLRYVKASSKTAAKILMRFDEEFISSHLDEEHLDLLLALLDSEEAKMIGSRISAPLPVEKNLRPLFREQPPASPPPNVHVIQPGENLWLIAKKYNVSLEKIMQVNHLQSTVIQPGKTLKIPFN